MVVESLAPLFCVVEDYYITFPFFCHISVNELNSKTSGNIVFYNADTNRDNIEDRYNAIKYVFNNYIDKTNTYTVCVIRYNNGYYFNHIFMKQASGDVYAVLEYTYHQYPISIYYYNPNTGEIGTSSTFSNDTTLQTNTESYMFTTSGEYSADCNDITQPGLCKSIVIPGAENSPGFYAYILVLRYKSYSDENLTQVAFPYTSSDPIKTRYRYSGAWSEWA